jgi:type III restriction enzyme
MLLKSYQEQKVQELISAVMKQSSLDGTRSIVFKAPTGSWKTIMMQEFLRRLAETPMDKEYAFVWVSVNDLSRQSKRSFERNLAGSSLHFSELSDIVDKELKRNEILFINWESIRSVDRSTGEWKVLAMKDNERDENLPTYLKNTHEAGRDVILIVDESHKALSTPKAQELVLNYIKPKVQIEVSATPDSTGYHAMIETDIKEVIEAGMIKKEVLINPEISEEKNIQETDRFILWEALKKASELTERYKTISSPVRPLVLIQLPSESKSMSEIDQTKMERTKKILKEDFDITLDNKRLAIWLSDEKENLDNIGNFDSKAEVLIFKQAIATGWDCPRAQILVMFREMGSVTFQIQTVGRILRMPELHHYDDTLLDVAYVYTDLERAKIGIHETAKNMIKDKFGYRKSDYESIALPSNLLRRTEYNDLGFSFYNVLTDCVLDYIGWSREAILGKNLEKLRSKFITEDVGLKNRLISDGKIMIDIDKHTNEPIFSTLSVEAKTEEELVKLEFDVFCREQVRPEFSNIARSYKAIIEALYITLEEFFFGRGHSRYYFQCLILTNRDKFMEILKEARTRYVPIRRAEIETKRASQILSRLWQVPSRIAYPEDAQNVNYQNNIITPCFTSPLSGEEKKFIDEYLEKENTIAWWHRNGVKTEQAFSVTYKDDNGETQNFFPDFIVFYKDGTIGIFDTKKWWTLSEGRAKHRALSQYLQENDSKKKHLIGWFIQSQWDQNVVFYKTTSDDYEVEGLQGWEKL